MTSRGGLSTNWVFLTGSALLKGTRTHTGPLPIQEVHSAQVGWQLQDPGSAACSTLRSPTGTAPHDLRSPERLPHRPPPRLPPLSTPSPHTRTPALTRPTHSVKERQLVGSSQPPQQECRFTGPARHGRARAAPTQDRASCAEAAGMDGDVVASNHLLVRGGAMAVGKGGATYSTVKFAGIRAPATTPAARDVTADIHAAPKPLSTYLPTRKT
jgi:hypothetical protein